MVLRQVHLDFHTSDLIKDIGKEFSKEDFKSALKKGNVESITVFAKCHHGVCYYPTQIGTMHPHLDFDLTGEMVDAAHEIGVRAPIYITAGWSDSDAISHPEWRAKEIDGEDITTDSFDKTASKDDKKGDCAWYMMCLNDGSYCNHIYEITEEICRRYKKVDGLFYDICFVKKACFCDECKSGMKKMGLNPASREDAEKYYVIKHQDFMTKCTEIMKKYHPDATIFFNSGGADMDKPQYHDWQTHFEMENLPTAWGGYDKFPLRAKFFKNKEKHYVGMTGKFHLDWGEFGGFKSKDALKYEVSTMALYGAGASIGDHMHPTGKMEEETYENIGYAYRYLEKIAPYCYGGESVADVAIYLSEKEEANTGTAKMLLEKQIDFELIKDNDFEKFSAVIIPSGAKMDDIALDKLNCYIKNGGRVVLMGDSLIKNNEFLIDTGLRYIGASEYDTDYLMLKEDNENIPKAPLLSNIPGHRTEIIDAEVYAEIMTPYFSRTYGHFCGHKNTPQDKNALKYPAVAKKGNVVYISHSLSEQYEEYGSFFHREYFFYALSLVYDAKIKIDGLGSLGRCTMINQEDKKRFCANMVYASPVKRGRAEVIEDIMPVYDIFLSFKTDKKIKRVYLPLDDKEIDFTQNNGIVEFRVPKLLCHNTILLEY